MTHFKDLIFLLSVTAIIFSCKGEKKTSAPAPVDCITERINKLDTMRFARTRQVVQYMYNGQKVYYLPSAVPDMYGDLLDSACNILCHPDGGITGRGDGQCTDFFSNRTKAKVLWEWKQK